ncbi:hypothetical protein V8F20_005705 [Naviculisporaceae sp. PSN 640]
MSKIEIRLPAGYRPLLRQNPPENRRAKPECSMLRPFYGEFERALESYRRAQGRAMGSRFMANRNRIGPWLVTRESGILATCAPFYEATKLTLETIEVVDFMFEKSPNGIQDLRLVHLCGENAQLKQEKPNIMILDLISQVARHQERFTGQVCAQDRLATMENLKPEALWHCFWERIRESGIQRLFVFLDNLDELFPACPPQSLSAKQALRFLAYNLDPLNVQLDIQLKVWITCKTPQIPGHFQSRVTHIPPTSTH